MNIAFNTSAVPLQGPASGDTVGGSASISYSEQLTNRTYLLQITQQPTTGAKHGHCTQSHIPISPPLILQLTVFDCKGAPIVMYVQISAVCDLYSSPVANLGTLRILNRDGELPSLVAQLHLLTEHALPIPTYSPIAQPLLCGSLVTNPQVSLDQQGLRGYFLLFSDLSIRVPGRYRLGISLTQAGSDPLNMRLAGSSVRFLAQVITDVFEVFQQLEDTAAPIPPQMPFSPDVWSSAGRGESALCQPQVNTLPNIISIGGTGSSHISNLCPLSYDVLHSRNCPNVPKASPIEFTPPHTQPDQTIKKARSYDRPGKKPAAPYRRDPLELQKHCQRRGGCDFAIGWIMVAFENEVSLEALVRNLDLSEVENAHCSASNGFQLRQAYDGFLVKSGHQFECGLCKEGNRTHWVHKKDAVRHLRKFHFGLADRCRTCCKDFYSTTELKIHRCVPVAT